MKNFILTFFLLLFVFGHTSNKISMLKSQKLNKITEKKSFLNSFIEGDQLFLNIPKDILEKPILFRRYDELKYNHNYMQVVWSKFNDKILLKSQSVISTSGIIIPFKKEVPQMDNIIGIFPLEKKYEGKQGYTINITNLTLRTDLEWLQFLSSNNGVPDPKTSLLLDVKNLENEVIIKTRQGLDRYGSTVSSFIYFGFSNLPEPMKGRRYDYRMGFWNEISLGIDYGIDNDGTKNSIANIARWRLEKKYKDQKLSEPIKPITFILSTDIPKKWRPYIKTGIEEWLPAFEAAGFKNAIVVKEVDSISDWQRNSIYNNIVYWTQGKYFRGRENKEGGGTVATIVDYRTGEILKSDVILSTSPKAYEDKYFIRAAPLDKRAQTFPFPDEVIGRMYQCLAAHETGHAFGLMDNNYGEYTYPVEKMNDVDWLKTMGYTPSVMNYSRPNNIVQPEDNVPPHLLVQKVGPTDIYNIRWAYTAFPSKTSLEEEEALESMIRLQDSIPWYRYTNSQHEVIGPSETNEVVETNDPVRSTGLALKNLKRVLEILPSACHNQKDNSRLEYLYEKTINLWHEHMRNVVSLIGGYDIQYKSINQPGDIYTPIPLDSQIEAIDFIIQNAFNAPKWLVNPQFNSKIRYSVQPDRVLQYQQFLVIELLRSQRMKRFEYMDSINGYEGIFEKYLVQMRIGLFKELNDTEGIVAPRNQELQLTYIDKMISIVQQERRNITVEEKAFDYTDYSRGKVMEQLMSLKKDLAKAVKRNKNNKSMGHWKLCLYRLDEI